MTSPGPSRTEESPVHAPSTPEARLFELSLDLLGLAGFDGYLKLVNPAWEQLGWTREEWLSRPYLEFIHPDDRERTAAEALSLATDRTETRDFEIRMLRKDGGHRWVIFSAHSTTDEELLYVVGKDVTDRHSREVESRVLQQVSASAANAANVEDALRVVLQTVCDVTGWNFGRVWRLNAAGTLLEADVCAHDGSERMQAFAQATEDLSFKPGRGLPGLAWESCEPAWVRDVAADPAFTRARHARDAGLRSGFATPMLAGNEVVGVIEFFSVAQREEDDRLQEMVTAIAAQVGTVVRRKETEEALHRTHEELVRREAQLANAQEIAHVGSWEWDVETNVVSWSDELYRIYGLEPRSWPVTYEEFLQRVHPDERPMVERTVTESRESHRPFGYEHRIVRPDGTVRVVLAHGEVIVEDGEVVRMIGTGQDITERKLAEEALARSNADLANFAYVASHDLSEPLRIVSGYVELLASRYRGQLDDQADQFIEYTVNAVDRMQKLISDLLAYSSIGSTPASPSLVDVHAVVEETLQTLGRVIQERSAELEVEELPAVRADAGQLGRLFQNLLGNALKFSAAERPWVSVSAQRTEGGWRFTVTDNGIGIAADDRRRVFQMFERGRGRDGYPGTGMGLAICKRIVDQHGGEIWVEEAAGGGSAFHFTLPDGGVRGTTPPG